MRTVLLLCLCLLAPSLVAGQTLQQATVTLTDAQITSLTAVDVVPRPGPGKAIVLIGAAVFLDTRNGGYTNVSSDIALWLQYAGQDASNYILGDYRWTGTGVQFLKLNPTTYDSFIWPGSHEDAGLSEDAQLELRLYNAAGLLTGGGSGNVLRVSVVYLVLDVTTGVFL